MEGVPHCWCVQENLYPLQNSIFIFIFLHISLRKEQKVFKATADTIAYEQHL